MKLAPLPKSKAKTAYGLLSEIQRLILAEPKRYDQTNVLYFDISSPKAQACGTVGCVAGWVAALKVANPAAIEPLGYAQTLLGLNGLQAGALFDSDAAGEADPRTVAHAKAGAKHIAAFQKKYASQLKATAV